MEISKDDAERILNWFGAWERTAKEIGEVPAEDAELFDRLVERTDDAEGAPE